MTNVADPVGAGLVVSLAQPGGNVTGFSNLSSKLNTKRLKYSKTQSQNSPSWTSAAGGRQCRNRPPSQRA